MILTRTPTTVTRIPASVPEITEMIIISAIPMTSVPVRIQMIFPNIANAAEMTTVKISDARRLSPSSEFRLKSTSNAPRCMEEERREVKIPAIAPRMLIEGVTRTISPGINSRTSLTEPK